jgi:hypothetical protein
MATSSDRGSFYRSDQFSFAKIGVPALYFKSGTDFVGDPAGWGKEQIERWEATNYHRPSDQIDAGWNFDGTLRDAQLQRAPHNPNSKSLNARIFRRHPQPFGPGRSAHPAHASVSPPLCPRLPASCARSPLYTGDSAP